MLESVKPWLLPLIVLLGVGVGWSWSSFRRWEKTHRALMAVCACLGIWAFTLFGQFHDQGVFGHQNFHSHDFYHYYFGSKYLGDWGYYDMYVVTVSALEEIGREEPRKAIRFERIRDLRGSARFLHRDQFLPLAAAARARFTPARWATLKKDLSFLRDKTMNNDWWHGVLLDNGFNPPPSFAVVSGAVANRIPFTEATWKYFGLIDFMFIGVGVAAICYAIGLVPGLFTLVVLGNAPITTYNWTGGSYFRQLWLFFLMLGVASLARRRWKTAGAMLGACTATVFFPVFFLAGAAAPVAYRSLRTGSRTRLIQLMGGAAAAMAVMVGLSLLVYGTGPWIEWHHRIFAHGATFFDNHLGLKKIVTFAPEVGRQAFGASDVVYPEWDRALVARAGRFGGLDLALGVVLSLWMVVGALRARPAEACLVVGSGLLVLWSMPAGYYTIYVGVVAAFVLANRSSLWAKARFAIVGTALVLAILVQRREHDLITQSYLLSVGWVSCILALCSLYWIERPAIALPPRGRSAAVGAAAILSAALFATSMTIRNHLHGAAFVPPPVLRGARVADMLDLGDPTQESAHHLQIAEALRQPRRLMDVYGYLVSDACGILRHDGELRYDLAPAPHGGRLVVRTDSYYAGELLTTVNGRSLPAAHLEPHKTLFAYLEIPLPPDLGEGPLHVVQAVTGRDVGVFTVWLLENAP